MLLWAVLVGGGSVAHAGLIACQPTVVTPCYIADTAGPILVTDPSQITFTIGVGPVGGLGTNAAFYNNTSGDQLAVDPAPIVAEFLAAGAALQASGNAPIASNPGGAVVVTNSTISYTSGFVDTPVAEQVNNYQTTIRAVLNGSNQVYTATFQSPFSDPAVQAAILAADNILSGDGATPGSPFLFSDSTSLSDTQVTNLVTGTSLNGEQVVSTVTTFGPAFIAVGDQQSDLFTVIAGQTDINVNTENFYATDRTVTTTSTYLTTQVYEIDGSTSISGVPEPATWTLMGLGLAAVAVKSRKRA
jgi:hypothetical protein